jgi:hypothetical protein
MVLGGKSRQIFGFKVLIRKVLWNKDLVTNSKRSVRQRLEAAVDSAVFTARVELVPFPKTGTNKSFSATYSFF